MIARIRRAALLLSILLPIAAVACQKVPLLAPSGSTITLTSGATVLPLNGTAKIIAQVIEPSGTPPHSGTHVTFTTTLGSISPADATTDINGQAIVTFNAGTQNGTAVITAISGGASATNAANQVKIAIGAAAVGRIGLSANPNTLSGFGGTTTVTAQVLDVNGNPLPSVPVTFTTSAGVLGQSVVNTDSSGNASTTLSTTVSATVTATAGVNSAGGGTTGGGGTSGGGTGNTGGTPTTTNQASNTVTISVNPLPVVAISVASSGNTGGGTGGGTASFTTGTPISFNVTVAPGTPAQGQTNTAQIRDVQIDFNDGQKVDLGAVTTGTGQGSTPLQVQHVYETAGTFTPKVIVTDNFGFQTTAATVVFVQQAPPLSVLVSASKTPSGTTGTTVTFTATVIGLGNSTAVNYHWVFGSTLTPQDTTSNTVSVTYPNSNPGTFTVSVTVTTSTGQQATGTTVIVIP